ncbi:hypothetical protein B0H14DRAFT_2667107 [Mycena olivaceomarginata]|nr:hypothetical protein B0H14DRAFT_2667107 [Mycena olivaceomarginata]
MNESTPVISTIPEAESSAWDPSALFFSPMDVDSPSLRMHSQYTMETQYSHIQSPDFNSSMSLASPFDSAQIISTMLSVSPDFALSAASNSWPSVFASPFNSPSRSAEPPGPTQNSFQTQLANDATRTTPSVDAIMRTPADLSPMLHAFKDATTPFGKSFELSDDWIPSGSYVSPIIRASRTKQQPLKLFSSPTMSFMDRLKATSSPSGASVPPRHAKHHARSSSPLLSPYRLTLPLRASVKKENRTLAQVRAPFLIDLFSSSPLTASPISRRSLSLKALLLSPQRPVNSLFPLSPLTPLTPKSPPAIDGKSKKRRLSPSISESPTSRAKRTRYNTPRVPPRTLPASVVVSPDFPLFYRRFPASSYFQTADSGSPCALFGVSHPGGEYKAPRSAFDLYSARFVKGKGADKRGLCPICIEPKCRGGEGKKVWLSMKFSAFNYHMQFHHGISAASGRPLSPPTDFRVVARPVVKGERAEIKQGKCHKCLSWVAIETVKNVEVKVRCLASLPTRA